MVVARMFIDNGYWHLIRICVDGLNVSYCFLQWELDLGWWL